LKIDIILTRQLTSSPTSYEQRYILLEKQPVNFDIFVKKRGYVPFTGQ